MEDFSVGLLFSFIDFLLGGLAEGTEKKAFVTMRLILWSILCWFIVLVCIGVGFTALETWGIGFAIICWILALIFFAFWICLCYIIVKTHKGSK